MRFLRKFALLTVPFTVLAFLTPSQASFTSSQNNLGNSVASGEFLKVESSSYTLRDGHISVRTYARHYVFTQPTDVLTETRWTDASVRIQLEYVNRDTGQVLYMAQTEEGTNTIKLQAQLPPGNYTIRHFLRDLGEQDNNIYWKITQKRYSKNVQF